MIVYYTDENPDSAVTPVMQFPLEKAMLHMDLPDQKAFPKAAIQKCPAFVDYYKNCFVYRSPIDITMTYQSFGNLKWDTFLSSQDQLNRLIEVRDDFGMFSISLYINLWCEESVKVEQIPINFMRSTPVSDKLETMVGGFDISKWYRPLQPAYRFKNITPEESVCIKRGDPLYLIRLVTDKKVKLTRFTPSRRLIEIANQINMVKSSNKGFFSGLDNYYEIYRLRKLHSQIKKEITTCVVDED